MRKKEKGLEHCRNTGVTKLTHYDTKEDEVMNVLYVCLVLQAVEGDEKLGQAIT